MSDDLPILDLTKIHDAWEMGDILVLMTWTLNDKRPAMVLIPVAAPRHNEEITPCIIPMDSAFMWHDSPLIGDPVHQVRMSGMMAGMLGFDPYSQNDRHKIINAIQNRLQDLITMPNMPDTGDVVAEVDLQLTDLKTGKVIEFEGKAEV